jgi:hypothetical protein
MESTQRLTGGSTSVHPRFVLLLSLLLAACGASTPAAGTQDAGATGGPADTHDVASGDASDAVAPDASAPDASIADAADTETTPPDVPVATSPDGCLHAGTPGATALCLSPTFPPEHYVEQALKYFDTLDVDADPASIPAYSDLVARWEWPPWLLLTGYERDNMIETAQALRVLDPSTVPVRDCRFFPVQPFARCRVVFQYEGGPCPVYEEFTFNDQGETTFIEAWSDLPDLRPMDPAADRWGEAEPIGRLSTRVPGLGNATGRIDLESTWMKDAEAEDPHVADFALRARDFWGTWVQAVRTAEVGFFARGCGW